MSNLAYPRNAAADLGGKHPQHRKLVYDTPNKTHNSDQRQTSSTDTAPSSANHNGGQGRGQSTSGDAVNEDDDEDSSADQEDEEEDPDILAPSHGLGKGKGKRPAIRIEPVGDDASPQDEQEEDETASRETGLTYSTLQVNQLLTPQTKKRTFSNLSNTSVLFGEHDVEEQEFPRTKMPRKLSHNGGRPLLAYKKDANGQNLTYENAIESDDEDKPIDVDDEDYSGVALISDDDESDMENVEQLEEHFIVSDEQHRTNNLFNEYFDARRLSLDSHASDNIFDVTAPLDESFLANLNVPDVGFGQFFEPEPLPASPDANTKRKYSDSSTKRVRFDDEVQVSSSSSSESSELDSSLFPDLFMEQDKLPPSLYQLLENDNDDTDNEDFASPGSDRSYWDVEQEESRSIKPNHKGGFDDESSEPGSSGYETDMGDTTDEYESDFGSPAPAQTPLQKSVLRRPSSAPASKASSPKPFQRNRGAPTGRTIIPPLRGIFIHEERSKAIAVTDRATKALTFYRPRAATISWNATPATYSSSASTANNSPRASLQQFNISDEEMSQEMFNNNNPFTADIMLTGIYGSAPTNNFLFAGDSVGPPEAFYPFISVADDGNIIDDEIDDDFDDDEDFEDDLNIGDFMDFGSDMDDTEAEQEEEMDIPATPATSMVALHGSTPAQPTPMTETPVTRRRNTSDVMLEHFDRGVVTAFRNNQNRHRDIANLPNDSDLRASVSRPIRSGRSAEALISPLRKRGAIPKKKIGSSPFAGVTKATSRLQSSVLNNRRGPPRMGTFS